MAKDINKWTGTGRLGADPESRRVRNGDDLVCNIRIACDNSYKDRDGREQGSVEWVPIVIFGHAADFADKYLRKGDAVAVVGQFKTRQWEDRDGNKRYSTEIVVDNFNGQIVKMGEAGAGRRDGDDRDRRDDRRSSDRDRDDRGRDRDRGDRDRGRDDRDRGRDDKRDDRRSRDDDRRDSDRGGRGRDDDRSSGRRDDRSRDEGRLDDDIPF